MEILFVAGIAPISADPAGSLSLYRDALGLPLEGEDDYKSTSALEGVKHFGVWPLKHAAQACFGRDDWPAELPLPQATLEFEMRSSAAVQEGIVELAEKGYQPLHDARLEPWGQTVARLLSPEGLLIGLSYAPWLHEG